MSKILILLFFGVCALHYSCTNVSNELITPSKKIFQDSLRSNLSFDISEKDTVTSNFEWGIESSIMLGKLSINKMDYSVYSIIKKISVADGYRGKSLLAFISDKSEEFIFFDFLNIENLPVDIIQNTLIFKNDSIYCSEELKFLKDDFICVSCLGGKCFFIE